MKLKLQPPTLKDRQAVLSQWMQQAQSSHLQGNLAEAETYYEAILKAQPNQYDAKHLLGFLRFQQGRNEDALKLLRQVVAVHPNLPQAQLNLGNVQATLRRLEEALASYDRALALKPDYAEAFCNRGVMLIDLKRVEEGLASCEKAIAIKPDYAEAFYNRGVALRELGQFEAELASYDKAIAIKPDYGDALHNRGSVLKELKRLDEALASYDEALAIKPENEKALNNRGIALLELKRPAEALASFESAIAITPGYAPAHNNRGTALTALKRPAEALKSYDKAIALKPDYHEAYHNRANALRELDLPEDSLADFDRAIALKPDYSNALGNRGIALHELRRHEEALASLDAALALEPKDTESRFGRGLIALTTGDLAAGWSDYEYRFDQRDSDLRRMAIDGPLWTGEPLSGKRILVYAEQGLGDVIQFSRYLPLLVARGATVTFLVTAKLHRLLRPLGPDIQLVDHLPAEPLDYQSPLMSLPGIFQTSLATIPAATPYLAADPDLIADWRHRIGSEGFKVGIVWQGNPTSLADMGRSYPLKYLEPIAAIPGIRLLSLQKNHGLEQLAGLPPTLRIETLGETFDAGPDAFVDTAAVMASLDLIITSDTAVAHLAGALGRPVWLALKRVPDWRWMLDRPDSPWYPTMTLYRQSRRGEWSDVFQRIKADLADRTSESPSP